MNTKFQYSITKQAWCYKFDSNKWEVNEYPKELTRLKTIFDWKDYPNDFKKTI